MATMVEMWVILVFSFYEYIWRFFLWLWIVIGLGLEKQCQQMVTTQQVEKETLKCRLSSQSWRWWWCSGEEDEEGEVKLSLADEELLADLTYDELKQAFRFTIVMCGLHKGFESPSSSSSSSSSSSLSSSFRVFFGTESMLFTSLLIIIIDTYKKQPLSFIHLQKVLNLKRADLYMKMITPSNLQLMWWSHHQKKFSSEVTSCHEAANYQLAVQRGWFLLITIHQIKKELLKAIEYFLSVWYSFFQAIWCRRRGFHSSGYI